MVCLVPELSHSLLVADGAHADSSQVDFTNPESFYHDVNSVAGLLKQFFRDLPDPLFTNERYNDFIAAARKSTTSTNDVLDSKLMICFRQG